MSVSRLAQMGNHCLPPALHLSTGGRCPSLLLWISQAFTQVTCRSWREAISYSWSWWVGQTIKAERQEKHTSNVESWKKMVPVLASRG